MKLILSISKVETSNNPDYGPTYTYHCIVQEDEEIYWECYQKAFHKKVNKIIEINTTEVICPMNTSKFTEEDMESIVKMTDTQIITTYMMNVNNQVITNL